ncbi:MAG: DUF1343 domain-containing protein [Pyrinomonadaceae bacterium]
MFKNLKIVELGLEKIVNKDLSLLKNQRVGLICNQASVNHRFEHSADLFFEHSEINLCALFGPQHGIRGDVQDNMVETKHSTDKKTGLPVYSLYSDTREPTEEMMSKLDTLVFDLQDVGCRVYTFIYTMAFAMRACSKFNKKFVVLDRPNPINGVNVEGNNLEVGHESFVGLFPIPMRHGLTTGELAMLFNREFDINCELEIVSMKGWDRKLYYDETDCPWVMPSPNMPTVDTAVVFPGTVMFEGTQISEGRGTTRPFEIVGATYFDGQEFATKLIELDLPGIIFRPTNFLPTFQKYKAEACSGVFLHVTDRTAFEPVLTGVALIKTAFEMYKESFKWKDTPYEYEFDRNPFDVINGSGKIRQLIEAGNSLNDIKQFWENDVLQFESMREKYLLY